MNKYTSLDEFNATRNLEKSQRKFIRGLSPQVFDISIALEFGLHIAILLEIIANFRAIENSNKYAQKDPITIEKIHNMAPYLTLREINSAMRKMKKMGMIKSEVFYG